ncbi:MFS transporter [Jiangella ureilytica]|uniref:Multidrug efflux pump Tap n=1 Tax=Jiangella ureilytica TaxID=2530374 RepID=A0A4R4RJ50_9ACTN|nr:MFS transporter [Jiangella ureilytica]TDC49527.1 MFS transporter [Jiangella ureilytica]
MSLAPSTAEATTRRRRLPLAAMLTAYLISTTCTAVSAIAIPWLVLGTTGSATRTGLVVLAEMAPYVAMQAMGGPWVERFGPRRASWLANLLAGLLLLAVPALFVAGRLGYGALVAVVCAVGALRGLADCGSAPLVPRTAALSRTPLERAAGLHASASQAGALLGAPLAAVLLTLMSAPLVLLASAGGFVVASALVGLLVPVTVGAGSDAAEPYLRRIATGVAFLARDPVLRALVVVIAATNTLSAGFLSVLLPSWVRHNELPVAAVGAVAAASGLGSLAGSLVGAWVAPRVNRWLVFAVGLLVGGSPLFASLALSDTVLPVVVAAGLCGLAGGGVNPVIGAVQYERIPADMQPRVLGAVKAFAWTGIPLGPVMVGALTDQAGVQAALAVAAAATFLLTLGPFVVPAFRLMNDRQPAPGGGPSRPR